MGRKKIISRIKRRLIAAMIGVVLFLIFTAFLLLIMIVTGDWSLTPLALLPAAAALGFIMLIHQWTTKPEKCPHVKQTPGLMDMAEELFDNIVYEDDFIIHSNKVIASKKNLFQMAYISEVFLVYRLAGSKKIGLSTATGAIYIPCPIKASDNDISQTILKILSICPFSKGLDKDANSHYIYAKKRYDELKRQGISMTKENFRPGGEDKPSAGFSYETIEKGTSIDSAIEKFRILRKLGEKDGFVPVIIPTNDDVLDEQMQLMTEDGYSVSKTLSSMPESGEEYLKKRYEEFLQYYDEETLGGEITEGEEITERYLFDSKEKVDETQIIKIPAKNPWEVTAYIPFGGWNECPAPDEMTAVCKYWFEKFGAVPAKITHDELIFILPEAISREEAMKTAKEHFAFCNDRLDQCTRTGTMGEIAGSIAKSKVWYFWWD